MDKAQRFYLYNKTNGPLVIEVIDNINQEEENKIVLHITSPQQTKELFKLEPHDFMVLN